MLSSLRTKLIAICALIVVISMIALSAANIISVRASTLDAVRIQMRQLTGIGVFVNVSASPSMRDLPDLRTYITSMTTQGAGMG